MAIIQTSSGTSSSLLYRGTKYQTSGIGLYTPINNENMYSNAINSTSTTYTASSANWTIDTEQLERLKTILRDTYRDTYRNTYRYTYRDTYRDLMEGTWDFTATNYDNRATHGITYYNGVNERLYIEEDYTDVTYITPEETARFSKKRTFKTRMRQNLAIHIKSRTSPVTNISPEEEVALTTLREMISESDFRRYLRDGFLCVRGVSGRMYQLFRNRWHAKVWENGVLVQEVCTRISSNINVPPTDNIIAFKVMIECHEDEFLSIGNVYPMMKAA